MPRPDFRPRFNCRQIGVVSPLLPRQWTRALDMRADGYGIEDIAVKLDCGVNQAKELGEGLIRAAAIAGGEQ